MMGIHWVVLGVFTSGTSHITGGRNNTMAKRSILVRDHFVLYEVKSRQRMFIAIC